MKNIAIDEKELEVAERESEQSENIYVHKFSKVVMIDGCPVETLTFDWSILTGEDSLAIENELQALGKAVIVPEFSGEYLIRMAERACTTKIVADNGLERRLPSDSLRRVPLPDYNKIRSRARSFLLRQA